MMVTVAGGMTAWMWIWTCNPLTTNLSTVYIIESTVYIIELFTLSTECCCRTLYNLPHYSVHHASQNHINRRLSQNTEAMWLTTLWLHSMLHQQQNSDSEPLDSSVQLLYKCLMTVLDFTPPAECYPRITGLSASLRYVSLQSTWLLLKKNFFKHSTI